MGKIVVLVVTLLSPLAACKAINPIGTAQAQTAADTTVSGAACAQWAYLRSNTSFLPAGPMVTVSGGVVESTLAPEGWEPYAVYADAQSVTDLFRKCVR